MDETPKLTRAIIDSVRGREIQILKNPAQHTAAEVAAADVLARVSWTEFSKLYVSLEDGAVQRRTEAN